MGINFVFPDWHNKRISDFYYLVNKFEILDDKLKIIYSKAGNKNPTKSFAEHEVVSYSTSKMKHLWTICVFLLSFYNTTTAKKVDGPLFQKPSNQLQRRNATIDKYIHQLRSLFVEILRNTKVEQCLAVITDDVHQSIYEKKFYDQRDPHLSLYLKLNNSEDMLSPNYQTVKVLKTIRMLKCDMFFITVLNGVQVKRFLIFTEKHRLLNTQEKMVFLYDKRILTTEMAYIWSTIVRNVFVKREWSPGK